jgi:hypothetical protein
MQRDRKMPRQMVIAGTRGAEANWSAWYELSARLACHNCQGLERSRDIVTVQTIEAVFTLCDYRYKTLSSEPR